MQKYFEKIKEKCLKDSRIGRKSLEAFIEIVKQVEEEYSISENPNKSDDCCEWVRDDYEFDVYDTKCKNRHVFFEGSPADNEYEFCPYCGKIIKVVE